jgi:CHAT domain-containing protein
MGGVDFDALPPAFPAGAVSTGAPPGASAPLCPDLATLRYGPLAGSERETEEIASLWGRAAGTLRLSGAAASESAFKRHAPSRRILHLATHAYSLPESCGQGGRSGLVLAGANHHADPATSGGEDGILTAEEIAALDLSGVELAVLSACDTGAGQVLDGEGVVGLRRAFDLAGARTLVTSLWPVDDGAARVWMRGLYEKRLSGLSTVDSVRAASLDLLRAQRALGRTTHPYFWGSFVAAGDWR